MRPSAIPIFGLVHAVSVIRKRDADDGYGGVIPNGTSETVYSSLRCRIAVMSGEDELEVFGFASGRRWQLLSKYAPKIRRSDFIRVPWGTFPNVESEVTLGNGMASAAVVAVPAGSVSLAWDRASVQFKDSTGNYLLSWDAVAERWKFVDSVAGTTLTFPSTVLQGHNIFAVDWSGVDGDYAVSSVSGAAKDYRILWMQHRLDESGRSHHTSIFMELAEGD